MNKIHKQSERTLVHSTNNKFILAEVKGQGHSTILSESLRMHQMPMF